ncbi:DUF5819 family protein [Streptomyces sp. NBC_00344]|uniref:DUF5819 family protein n=1 Tax=Streptomyces sp. NBC_00344 TaxID=2975720 RepID=UPI002E1D6715
MQTAESESPGGVVPGEMETADLKERQQAIEPVPEERDKSDVSARPAGLQGSLKTVAAVVTGLFVTTSLVHVLLVFLYVAPSNAVSQRYSRQVNAWVYPLFEQNWRVFAPDPEAVNQQISARTAHTSADGKMHVSPWFNLTAVDDSAVEHDPFPSHTSQNMLRRAWSSYLDSHGGDDQPRSARALMMQQYLRNIAVQRSEAHRRGAIESVQLRVLMLHIAAPGSTNNTSRSAPPGETRYLPWWKVTSHDN